VIVHIFAYQSGVQSIAEAAENTDHIACHHFNRLLLVVGIYVVLLEDDRKANK